MGTYGSGVESPGGDGHHCANGGGKDAIRILDLKLFQKAGLTI
jgi:hypothetical protein